MSSPDFGGSAILDTPASPPESEAKPQEDRAAVPHIAWLASYPRSGNTWVRMMLSAYRDGHLNLNAERTHIGRSDSSPYFYNRVSPIPIERVDVPGTMMLRSAMLMHLLACYPEAPLVLKTHWSNGGIEGYRAIPPFLTRKAVYLIRDPRDVAISYARHFGIPITLAIDALVDRSRVIGGDPTHSFQVTGSWAEHVDGWVGEETFPVLPVHYEDLLERPQELLGAIVKFLYDEEPSQLLIENAVQLTAIDRFQSIEEAEGFYEAPSGRRFFGPGASGQWKDHLTASQIDRIQYELGETMKRCEYLPTFGGFPGGG